MSNFVRWAVPSYWRPVPVRVSQPYGGLVVDTAVSETPTPGGAVAAGTTPVARATAAVGGAVADTVSPAPKVALAPGAALAGGQAGQASTVSTSGGALADGTAPAPRAAVAVGAAVADGVAAAAVAPLSPGGAVAGGQLSDSGITETAGVGGASAGGTTPTAAVLSTTGPAIAGGVAPSEVVEASSLRVNRAIVAVTGLPPVGVTQSFLGYEPTEAPPETLTVDKVQSAIRSIGVPQLMFGTRWFSGVQVFDAGETAPAGGASADGRQPVAVASVFPGGAVAQGNAPTARAVASVGGATAGGVSPIATVVSTRGGADAAAPSPAAVAPLGVGGAEAGGLPPSDGTPPPPAVATVTRAIRAVETKRPQSPVTQVFFGFEVAVSETPAVGGAVAGGNTLAARILISRGGADAGGLPPTETLPFGEIAGRGGALAGGSSPTARAASAVGGALAGSTTPVRGRATLDRGGAVAGGQIRDPLQLRWLIEKPIDAVDVFAPAGTTVINLSPAGVTVIDVSPHASTAIPLDPSAPGTADLVPKTRDTH